MKVKSMGFTRQGSARPYRPAEAHLGLDVRLDEAQPASLPVDKLNFSNDD